MDGLAGDGKQSIDNVKDIKPCLKNLTCFRARQSPQLVASFMHCLCLLFYRLLHALFIVTAKMGFNY